MIDRNSLWTTRLGNPIAIKDMDDDHIRNCITLISTSLVGRPWRAEYLVAFEEELELRKTMAESPLGRALE